MAKFLFIYRDSTESRAKTAAGQKSSAMKVRRHADDY